MGAGKTTVGRRLAAYLKTRFVDTDHLVEERTGVSVSHIFEVEGEQGFRERESRILCEVSELEGAVVSTGGGIVLAEENCRVMKETGTTIYLDASMDTLWKRLEHGRQRPLLQTNDPQQTLRALMEARDPLYRAQADHVVEVVGDSANHTARRIRELLEQATQGD